ncbi:MAG: FkbM family methyltransferase [Nitrospirae bacterium]|nr:FkbM family methyltransferase [Nitrospirota bacterium]
MKKKFFNYKNEVVSSVFRNLRDFAIFGASGSGRVLNASLRSCGFEAKVFFDNDKNKIGMQLDGVEVCSPDEIGRFVLSHVLIGCMYSIEVKEQLLKNGFAGEVLDFCFIHERSYARHYDTGLIDRSMRRIEEAKALFSDEESRKVLHKVIEYRKTLDPLLLPFTPNQYFDDRTTISPGDTVLDIGGYDGDTAEIFSEKVGNSGAVYSFEPVEETFNAMKSRLNNGRIHNVIPLNLGVWSSNAVMRIDSDADNRVGSKIGRESGGNKINVVSIDSYVEENKIGKIDFIKMDIEGAEREALKGAALTVRRMKPNLAICVYHQPDDLWEIPLIIKEMVPEYRLFLLHHSQSIGETVCYASARQPACKRLKK